jgi:hypothetical protein
MGNILEQPSEKIYVNVKERVFKNINVHIPYPKLQIIRVLQREFDYEVKGTIYVDENYIFKSFEVRTDNSEIYSYGSSDWRISFHTHPDKTAQKYGIRYFSPPSVDDILEIYDHSLKFMPQTQRGFGEISIIFTNEGIYILQVNRDSFREFNKEDLPVEGLEEILNSTLTAFLVSEVKKGIQDAADGNTIDTPAGGQRADNGPVKVVDYDNPAISIEDYSMVLRRLCRKVSQLYGFDMSFHSWLELETGGLDLKICDYFLSKVAD